MHCSPEKRDWRENYERFVHDAMNDPYLRRRFYSNPEEVAQEYKLGSGELKMLQSIAEKAKPVLDQPDTLEKLDTLVRSSSGARFPVPSGPENITIVYAPRYKLQPDIIQSASITQPTSSQIE